MENKELYDLTASQKVIKLQFDHTLFKWVANILISETKEKEFDYEIMKKAINILVERNDCLRIHFVKQGKVLKQYFEDKKVIEDIPCLKFETKEEQDKFFNTTRKKVAKYLKGEVFIPHFIKTYDGKNMIFFKVSHFVVDMYGLYFLFDDLFKIYDALVNGTELPKEPRKFEDLIKHELTTAVNKDDEHEAYYKNIFQTREEPTFLSFDGGKNKYCSARAKKGIRSGKFFLLRNDTDGFESSVSKDVTSKIMEYCEREKLSPANVLLYSLCVALSKINNDAKNLIPLELCNMRGTLAEKNCAGTKVKASAAYTTVDQNKTFNDAIHEYALELIENHRHAYYPELKLEMLIHGTYKSSMLSTYWPFSFSFVPFAMNKDWIYNVYSNGKSPQSAYIALFYNASTGELNMGYDFVKLLMNKEDVAKFHDAYVSVLTQIGNNPNILIKDIKVK